jgi:hypothetical protein
VAASSWRLHCEEEKPGEEIVERFRSNDLTKVIMGRRGGLAGRLLENDIAHGKWKQQKYQTSARGEPPNQNWFMIEEFVDLVSR